MFSLFSQLGTQWNTSMGGIVGLRYEAMYPLLDRQAQDADEWQDLFDDLRTLERAALSEINKAA